MRNQTTVNRAYCGVITREETVCRKHQLVGDVCEDSRVNRPLIIRLFLYLDNHESVILQKTSLKGLIQIIKSTYQG